MIAKSLSQLCQMYYRDVVHILVYNVQRWFIFTIDTTSLYACEYVT